MHGIASVPLCRRPGIGTHGNHLPCPTRLTVSTSTPSVARQLRMQPRQKTWSHSNSPKRRAPASVWLSTLVSGARGHSHADGHSKQGQMRRCSVVTGQTPTPLCQWLTVARWGGAAVWLAPRGAFAPHTRTHPWHRHSPLQAHTALQLSVTCALFHCLRTSGHMQSGDFWVVRVQRMAAAHLATDHRCMHC